MVWHLSTLSIHLSSRLAAWSGTGNPYCLHALIPAFSKVILIPLGLSWCRIPLHRMGISEYPSNGHFASHGHSTNTFLSNITPSKSANPPIEKDHCNLIKEKMINWPYASESLRNMFWYCPIMVIFSLKDDGCSAPFSSSVIHDSWLCPSLEDFSDKRVAPLCALLLERDWMRRTWSLFLVTGLVWHVWEPEATEVVFPLYIILEKGILYQGSTEIERIERQLGLNQK